MKPIYQKLIERWGFSPAQKIIFQELTPGKLVLEIGSSAGFMTRVMQRQGLVVDIVEKDEKALKQAKRWARQAFGGSIEDKKVRAKIFGKYEVIVCADVLEHLIDPENTLEFLKKKIKTGGFLLISLPNVAFWDMRLKLLFKGTFGYQESGLLDKTHLRFYSLNDFLKILSSHKLKVEKVIPAEGHFPLEYSLRKIPFFGPLFVRLFKPKLIWLRPNLTFYHYVVKATPKS